MGPGAAIAGVAMALPERLVSNDQLAARLGVDPAWIAKRTGTRERPWASGEERLSQLAAQAGRAALEQAGVEPGEIDLVLVATSTADEITPNAAPLVAGLIGASGAGALDVGAACTGWVSALAMACGQIESGRARHTLVVGADFLSRFLDVSDRDTAPLFADGAGAAVVSATDSPTGRVGPDRAPLRSLRIAPDPPGPGRSHPDGGPGVVPRRGGLDDPGHRRGARRLRLPPRGHRPVRLPPGQLADHPRGRRAPRPAGSIGSSTTWGGSPTPPPRRCRSRSRSRNRRAGSRPGHRVLLAAFGGGLTWGATVVEWTRRRPPRPTVTRA